MHNDLPPSGGALPATTASSNGALPATTAPSGGALPASAVPSARGLYDPRFEHDSCGVSFVVHIQGVASHRIVQTGLGALCSMEHRGATGAEPDTGDGAGILLQVPDKFLRKVAKREGRAASSTGAGNTGTSNTAGFELPARGAYAVGLAFLPADTNLAEKSRAATTGRCWC